MTDNEDRPKVLVLVTDYDKVAPLIRWAAKFAKGWEAELVVLCCSRRWARPGRFSQAPSSRA